MSIQLPKIKIDLEPIYGSEWKGAEVYFLRSATQDVLDIQAKFKKFVAEEDFSSAIQTSKKFLLSKFVEGKGMDSEGKLIDLQKDDFEVFDISFFEYCLGFVLRGAKK